MQTGGFIRIMRIVFAALSLLLIFSSCEKPAGEQHRVSPDYNSFRDIPGVTEDEIRAIEALRREYTSFIYGMNPTTEAFADCLNHDEIKGFSALFCEWLSGLFGIPFKPTLYNWGDLMAGLENGGVDFTGDLMATPERKRIYFMTDAIVERSLKTFRIAGNPPLSVIARSRLPRFAFLENSAVLKPVLEAAEYPFEYVFVNNFSAAYDLLKSGEADAFLVMGISEATFDTYHDVRSDIFLPLVYNSASLSTQTPRLAPVIGVMQKALQHDAVRRHLADLYKAGYNEYRRHSLLMQLTADELEYLQNNEVVKFGAEIDNYPVSFFNVHENMWQGVALEVLREVENFTGLRFEIANAADANWTMLLNMLYRGDIAMITELVQTPERAGRFLWPHTAIMEDRTVLLSKLEFPDIDISEISNRKIGVIRNSVYAELFMRWFPNHTDVTEYYNMEDILGALESGEIELMMGRTNQFLNIINYHELFGFKINVIFNNQLETVFGFNKDEAVLCSIIDKSLRLIDMEPISMNWSCKAYDYRYKVIEAQRPWLFGAIGLFLVILSLILVLFYRSHNEGKRLARIVAEETSTLTAIFDSSPEHMFCKDLKSRYTRINKSMENYYKVEKADVIGKNDVEALGTPPELAAQYIELDKKVFNEKQVVVSEEFVPSSDGGVLFFETMKAPLIQNGKVTGLVALSRDMTRHKATEEEAKSASLSKSQFLANMSHEIRTPMNAILGITEIILQNETLAQDVKEGLYKIYNSGDLLLNIINDILDLSKIEAGKLELLPAPYDMPSLINDTVSLNLMRVGSKRVVFKLAVAEDIPTMLFGDDLRIKQILNNLLSNAFKYTPEGDVKLTISVEEGSGNTDVTIIYSVSDTGPGMSKEQVNKLFSEYTRFNTGANRTTEGTGLGLHITHNLVKLMNGGISVKSEPGKGSVFTVRLPQRKIGSYVLGRELAEKLQKFEINSSDMLKRTQVVFEPMPYGSVLIVDDVESNLYVAKGLLAAYGLSIDTAVSGFEAIEKVKSGKVYDIIFMDHMMPEMDGVEATQKIRKRGYAAPVIALTANAVVGQSDIFLENGFNGFIPKPIDVRQLNVILRKFVRDKQPPELIAAANQKKRSHVQSVSGAAHQSINPELGEIFARDAAKSIKVLEAIYEKRDSYGDGDIQLYTINTHAMKSALANMGEKELSAFAFRLEQAGRAKDTVVMTAETPAFLDELRTVIEKFAPQQEDDDETVDEDRGYLREKLMVIVQACVSYDRKTAKDAIKELRQRKWSRPTREILGTMSEHLLRGDFEEIINSAKRIIEAED